MQLRLNLEMGRFILNHLDGPSTRLALESRTSSLSGVRKRQAQKRQERFETWERSNPLLSLKTMGTNKEGKGWLEAENYCWLIASKEMELPQLHGPNSQSHLQRMNELRSRYFPRDSR